MKKKTILMLSFLLFITFELCWGNIQHKVSFSKSDVTILFQEGFSKVRLPGCLVPGEPGSPELPVKSVSLVIPQDVKVTGVRLVSAEKQRIKGNYFIYPAQLKVPFGEIAPFSEPNKKIYESEKPYPGKVIELAGDGFMNGYHIAGVLVYPLQYIPAKGELYLYTDVVFEVQYESAIRDYVKPREIRSDVFKKRVESIIDNPQELEHYEPLTMLSKPSVTLSNDTPYVIITTQTLSPAFESLAEWKTKKGTPTKIEYLPDILSGYSGEDDAEKIRNFIIDAYTNYNTEWILLGGDVDIIPARYAWIKMYGGQYLLTDYYYACLDGDWNYDEDTLWGEAREDSVDLLAEVNVGRIPVSDLSSAQTFINKLFSYEKESPYFDYQTKALFLSSHMFEGGDGQEFCDTLINYFPDHFTIEGPWYDYHSDTGIVKMNEGYGIICNYSHAQDACNFLARHYNPIDPIYYYDIDSLVNTNRYSVMLNVTCQNVKLDTNCCLAKHFIQNEQGGGVGYLGSSLFDFPDIAEYMIKDFFDRLFNYSSSLGIGENLNLSKPELHWLSKGNSAYRYLMLSYLLLGDPQMEVWTETPKDLVMSCSTQTMECGPNTIYVRVKDEDSDPVAGALVCLMQDDEAYEVKHTNSLGCVAFSGSFRPWSISLVASKKNHIPVETSMDVGDLNTPDDVQADPISPTRIRITWTDNSQNETAFEICRKDTGPYCDPIATVPSPAWCYVDYSVECDSHSYCYQVRAIRGDTCGSSRSQPPACATTDTCPTPECPFLYVWNGQGFVNDNVILTGSEDDLSDKLSLTDYYVLSKDLKPKDDKYELEIREFENEISRIDDIKLFAIEHPPGQNIGVTPQGKVWIYSDPVSPISCVDQDGVDHLDEILSKDEKYFSSNRPGHLVVNFGKLRGTAFFKPSGQMASGGGGGTQPPPKEPPPGMRVSYSSPSSGNIAYVDVIGDSGEWENVAKLYPRTSPVLTLVELSQYVKLDEDFKIKIRWEQAYAADHIAYYRFDDNQLSIKELPLSSAAHSLEGDINAVMTSDDDQRAVLSPDQTIQLSFAALPEDSSKQRSFLFVAKGYYEKSPPPPASTQDMARTEIPKMDQNYPNPFNASTGIKFTLPEPANVTLNIYNILGQKIASLVDEEKPAGTHTVFWDGKDKNGAEVASGIYLYQIRAGDFKELKKMLLIK